MSEDILLRPLPPSDDALICPLPPEASADFLMVPPYGKNMGLSKFQIYVAFIKMVSTFFPLNIF